MAKKRVRLLIRMLNSELEHFWLTIKISKPKVKKMHSSQEIEKNTWNHDLPSLSHNGFMAFLGWTFFSHLIDKNTIEENFSRNL